MSIEPNRDNTETSNTKGYEPEPESELEGEPAWTNSPVAAEFFSYCEIAEQAAQRASKLQPGSAEHRRSLEAAVDYARAAAAMDRDALALVRRYSKQLALHTRSRPPYARVVMSRARQRAPRHHRVTSARSAAGARSRGDDEPPPAAVLPALPKCPAKGGLQ